MNGFFQPLVFPNGDNNYPSSVPNPALFSWICCEGFGANFHPRDRVSSRYFGETFLFRSAFRFQRVKPFARGISWPLSLIGAVLGHGGLALWMSSMPPAPPLSATIPSLAFIEEADETYENESSEVELTEDSVIDTSEANPPTRAEGAHTSARNTLEHAGFASRALSEATDIIDGKPSTFTDSPLLVNDDKNSSAFTVLKETEEVISFGETSETGARGISGEPRPLPGPRPATRFARGVTRRTSSGGGLPRAPQLRSGSACGDLFSSVDRKDATSVLVRVDVSSEGRAKLHDLISAGSSTELVRASAACVSRLRFEPAVDAAGRQSTGLATLRLRLVEPG